MTETTDIGQYCREYDRLRGNCFLRKADVELPDRQLRLLGATRDRETHSAAHVLTGICREHWGNSKLRLIPISGSGTFHIIFEVRNEKDCLSILKFGILPENQRCMEFSIEVWAQQKLKASGLPWLQTERPCYDRRQAHGDFQFQAAAPGRTFKELLIDPELDPKKTIGTLGETMAGFHQIKGKGAGLIKVFGLEKETDAPEGLCSDWNQFLTGRLESHLDTCRQDQVLGPHDILRIQSMFSELSKEPAMDSPSLLHGDPGNGNLFAENEEISAIIDWEDALVGDPVFDIASWAAFYGNLQYLDPFLDGYRSVSSTPTDYHWKFWLYFLRISIARYVHRRRFNYPDPKEGPPAHHRIHKALEELKRHNTTHG